MAFVMPDTLYKRYEMLRTFRPYLFSDRVHSIWIVEYLLQLLLIGVISWRFWYFLSLCLYIALRNINVHQYKTNER